MTETAEAAVADSSPPKGKKTGAKKAGKKAGSTPSHPPISQMVTAAVRELKEKGGSSTQAIKKYISSNYKIDVEKKSKFIAKYLKSAVSTGALVQTKGKGASGSFKLPGSGGSDSKPKKTAAKKTKSVAAKPKKPAAAKRKTETKKSPSKVKKAKKPPTTPKPPKAKKATTPKVKKTAPAKTKSPAKKKPASKKKAAPKKK